MIREHIHQALNQEITAIGGRYVLVKEARLPFRGQEVLYVVGHAAFATTCCGTGGCAYALVSGFIASWKSERTGDDLPVSQVEPIRDQAVQSEIRRLIEEQETVHQVQFQ